MAWLGIGFTLGWNYAQYKRGRLTICAGTRAVIPEALFVVAFRTAAGMLEQHVRAGYHR